MASAHAMKPEDLNVLQTPLEQHGISPVTGFFRDNYCRPSPLDPASHTLAGIVTREFLEYSKAQGNDLMSPRPGFEGLTEGCRWCLCVSRWKEALLASRNHPQGDRIVPKVNLRGTSLTAIGEGKGKVTMEELERFKE
ncbi:hypothetical protein NliqN6_6427 [Naganishia liquefaciens]|uniref:DUF2237 domain-containing protein n=1 Tax=Naganishia liquefaciens TaxID=104408 RepID=A0A8H3YHI4_9TREE|nr:hypothetical protein NliqN6_6427 [Naganishia liquefaciens]